MVVGASDALASLPVSGLWRLASVVAPAGEDDARVVVRVEEGVMESVLLDAAGRRRSPATMPGFHSGRGRPWAASSAREELRAAAVRAGVRRRFAPHQLRHAHAVEMAREGIPITVIQRQLGHAALGVTSVYLRGIDNGEIIDTVHGRRAPMMSATAGLRIVI